MNIKIIYNIWPILIIQMNKIIYKKLTYTKKKIKKLIMSI